MAERVDRDVRVARLTAKAQARAAETLAKARRSIMGLSNRGMPVTFRTVAADAGVSESYLRKHPDLASQVRALAGQTRQATVRAAPARQPSIASMETKMLVMSDRLDELEDEAKRLKADNEALRGELLAERRKNRRR